MALFNSNNPKEKQHSGILGAFAVDVIKWEPESDQAADIIVHKYEYEDFPNGSSLIIGPSQMALFVNNMAAGSSTEISHAGNAQIALFTQAGRIKLDTGNSRFTPFRNLTNALTGGESAFHATVYFINATYMNDLNWGTREPVKVVDPEEEVNIHVRAQGMFGAHIEHEDPTVAAENAYRFICRVVGTRANYTHSDLLAYMRNKICEYVPDLLAKAIVHQNIGILKISAYLRDFSEQIYTDLVPHFAEFGMTLDSFSFHAISAPDEDLALVNEAKIRRKQMQLEAEGNASAMTIESEAMAAKRAREGYTYQQEQAFNVMGAAASNEGSASGLMGAGMGLGMGFGMGGAFQQGMQNVTQTAGMNVAMTPPSAAQQTVACPACGQSNPAAAKFCANCGGKMVPAGSVCPNCGKPVTPGAKFCMECGTRLGPKVCPNCGKEVTPGAKFCLECGTSLQ